MKFHILKVLYDLESRAKDGRCGLYRNEDIRRFVGKLVEKQTLGLDILIRKDFINIASCVFKNKHCVLPRSVVIGNYQSAHINRHPQIYLYHNLAPFIA